MRTLFASDAQSLPCRGRASIFATLQFVPCTFLLPLASPTNKLISADGAVVCATKPPALTNFSTAVAINLLALPDDTVIMLFRPVCYPDRLCGRKQSSERCSLSFFFISCPPCVLAGLAGGVHHFKLFSFPHILFLKH